MTGGAATAGAAVLLGAPAPGGLMLPDASPAADHLYAPRGIHLDDDVLVVADSGNHRVLVWHGVPEQDGAPADVVLGQPRFDAEGPAAGGRGVDGGLHLPCGVLVHEGRLLVADSWHHRVLVWDEVPRRSDAPPDHVLGQARADAGEPNRGGAVDATSLYWPYGLGVVGGWLWIADTGNRRVLGWDGIPEDGRPADVVLGQPDATASDENRGRAIAGDGFRWAHDVAGTDDVLYVADAGNHRVLGYRPPPAGDAVAADVLGQPDLATGTEWPYGPQSGGRLRFPYAVVLEGERLAVADTANNRVLVWDALPAGVPAAPADHVLGQPDMAANGENRWQANDRDTLCWPYGLSLHRGVLAIADSGNNRALLWRLPEAGA